MSKHIPFFKQFEKRWPAREIIKKHLSGHSFTVKRALAAERVAYRMDLDGIAERDREEAGDKIRSAKYESEEEDEDAEGTDSDDEQYEYEKPASKKPKVCSLYANEIIHLIHAQGSSQIKTYCAFKL